ncbi:unnamed protein product [Polarella glacialis]|uniref:Uncharacterized protein n=1 Tax=Polarella glacialis TaxID=89957 RepID=A0A813LI83_POLGL|nr:unnamed protein product [Polarella glacialis]
MEPLCFSLSPIIYTMDKYYSTFRHAIQNCPPSSAEKFMQKRREMFAEFAQKKDNCAKSYKQYGKCLKFGLYDGSTSPTTVSALLRTSVTNIRDKKTSLNEYVDRIQERKRHLLHLWHEHHTGVTISIPRDPAHEVPRGFMQGGPHGKVHCAAAQGFCRQGANEDDEKKKLEELNDDCVVFGV